MTEKVKQVCMALRQPDKKKALSLMNHHTLNHVEKKILVWGFVERMSIKEVSDRLCLSETRVKHLKRGALDKLYNYV